MRTFWRICALITGVVGVGAATIWTALFVLEFALMFGLMIVNIFVPETSLPYDGRYEPQLIIDYMSLVFWGFGGLLAFLFFAMLSGD